MRKKKIGHYARLGENNLSLIWPTDPQRKPSWFGLCARSCARQWRKKLRAVRDAQCNTRESP